MDRVKMDQMITRWTGLLQNSGWDVMALLVHMYSEPQRRYHTLDHIDDLLTKQEKWFPDVSVEVKLAIWFHDCFYLPGFGENENFSAAIMQYCLYPKYIDATSLDEIDQLIAYTINHDVNQMSYPGADIVCDLDLSGLGDTPEKYDRNTENVRAEYARYSDAEWAVGRSKFIDSFLARPKIFHTETLAHLEGPARANLARERKLYE